MQLQLIRILRTLPLPRPPPYLSLPRKAMAPEARDRGRDRGRGRGKGRRGMQREAVVAAMTPAVVKVRAVHPSPRYRRRGDHCRRRCHPRKAIHRPLRWAWRRDRAVGWGQTG